MDATESTDRTLDRILVTFGMDDDRAAVWLTRFVGGGDLVMRSIDLGDVIKHTINVLAVHDAGDDLAQANQDRATLAIALRAAADRIAASVVPLEAPAPLELEARAARRADDVDDPPAGWAADSP